MVLLNLDLTVVKSATRGKPEPFHDAASGIKIVEVPLPPHVHPAGSDR
jgi:hypothetical protein